MSRLILRAATVVDGTGADPYRADVTTTGMHITDIAGTGSAVTDGAQVIDADGLVLAPGFIDTHSHADNAAFLPEPDLSKISQGVTTEVTGNCGFSLAPCPPERRDEMRALVGRIFPPLDFAWSEVSELYGTTDRAGYTINAVPLTGHSTVRTAAMGLEDRAPTADELARMRAGLREAIEAGSWGLSSGLIYPPGMFGDVDELVALAAELPEGAVYATHMRGEGRQILDSVDEAVAVARRAGCRLQVSHLKAAGRGAWGLVPKALKRLDSARAQGVIVHHDVYPYVANSTMLSACLPPWFQDGGHEATMRRLHDSAALARAETDLAHDDGTWENWVGGSGYHNIVVATTATHLEEGLTLDEVAAARGVSAFGALIALLLENELSASMCVFAMDEGDVEAALLGTGAMIGSDGLPPGTGGKPHPRLYGTFTRVLGRYVRERALLSLPEAVAMMTSRPAAAFRLRDRGVLRRGAIADLVLLNPDTVTDRATFSEPHQLSEGIELVVLGGRPAYASGRALSPRAGLRLRPEAHSRAPRS
ncbi:N-acyl-D-amino-acid deacylase family protein [Mycolicibacterium mengxianglii]|uniref:N-acyl-D-amino-acid deacylase family protein n=1 Tax=Mycolicibacterium mengxianglii TaxID=2736649 RepID=UPI0018D1DA30|nr:amidohydrolase family protein [Mycolicibacterium mengxianglii]